MRNNFISIIKYYMVSIKKKTEAKYGKSCYHTVFNNGMNERKKIQKFKYPNNIIHMIVCVNVWLK